jgi:uncharacterized membrane protein YbhN (UPF0104 family)
MRGKVLQVVVGLAIAALFIVLSIRSVDLNEVVNELRSIHLWWIPPYVIVVLLSNLARAERWKMLLDDETGEKNSRLVMMSGVMYGYMANMLIPRAGEVFRAVYASRHTKLQTTKLFGTIVLERIIDLFMMMVFLIVTFVLLIRDKAVLEQLFGTEGAIWVGYLTSAVGLSVIVGLMVIVLIGIWFLRERGKRGRAQGLESEDGDVVGGVDEPVGFWGRLLKWGLDFARGLVAIRKLKNWPLFVFYTLFIWFTYVVTSLMPFWAFGFDVLYGFGWPEAFVITIIGGIGVVLPSPGGVGTYHYMVQTGLVVLYQISAVTALSYATVSHFVNVSSLILISIGLVIMNSLRSRRDSE